MDDLGKACFVCCRDSPTESLDSTISKLLDVFHGVLVEAFTDCNVCVVFEELSKGSESISFLLWSQISILDNVFELVMR